MDKQTKQLIERLELVDNNVRMPEAVRQHFNRFTLEELLKLTKGEADQELQARWDTVLDLDLSEAYIKQVYKEAKQLDINKTIAEVEQVLADEGKRYGPRN